MRWQELNSGEFSYEHEGRSRLVAVSERLPYGLSGFWHCQRVEAEHGADGNQAP